MPYLNIKWSPVIHSEMIDKYIIPENSGVYLLVVKLQNASARCHYVGKTENLKKRLSEHFSSQEKNPCILKKNKENYTGFIFAEANVNDISGIEKFLYDSYRKPECNEQDPGGIQISVNLPDLSKF